MRLTPAQKNDLETIRYFIPRCLEAIEIQDHDIKRFLEYSERGLHKEDVRMSHFRDGFNTLVQGKIWRGRHMELYEDGVMDGSMPYRVICEDAPQPVLAFMRKEMFKGQDADKIY